MSDNGRGKVVITDFNAEGKRTEQTVNDNEESYSVKYDGKGNTYIVVQNGESPAVIAQKFHTNTKTLLAMNRHNTDELGNQYFEVGKTIRVPGEFNANAGVIRNRKSAEDAKDDYVNSGAAWREEYANQEAETRKDNKITWTEKKYNTFADIARSLYKQEGIDNPSTLRLSKRVAELKKSNPNLKDGELIGKKITAPVDTGVYYKVVQSGKDAQTKQQVSKIYNSIKSKYPVNKYDIEITADKIIIKNKSNKNTELVVTVSANNSYSIENYKNGREVSVYDYDKNGKLISYAILNEKVHCFEVYNPISEALYKDITAKTSLGLPTTGNDFEKHIKQITPDNVIQVLDGYKNRHDESLLDAINSEWGLSDDVKTRVLKHLNDCIIKSTHWQRPNCKFDENFEQGQIGDCWFLASIAAAKRSPKGREILNNTIKKNADGSYTVKFKGADKAYTVTPLELLSNSDYASGDPDVRVLELAAQKHYKIGIEGGNAAWGLDLLLGTDNMWKNLGRSFKSKPNPDEIAALLRNPNAVITTSINPYSKLYGVIFKEVKNDAEYKDEIATSHEYALVGIDSKYVYLQNPWDTSKTIKIPFDVFDDYWADVQYVEIK